MIRSLASLTFMIGLAGCGDLIGADFDRPPRASPTGATPSEGSSGELPSDETKHDVPDWSPLLPSGACPAGRKRCASECVRVEDPAFGCGCAPCADGGFEPAMEQLPSGLAIAGTGDEVFVAANAFDTKGQVLHRDGEGKWTSEALPEDRWVIDLAMTPSGDLYAGTTANVFTSAEAPPRPLFHRSPGGTWEALGLGDGDHYGVRSVWASSPSNIFVVVPHHLRHYEAGTWTREDMPDGASPWRVWGTDPTHVVIVTAQGEVYRRAAGTPVWSPLANRPTQAFAPTAMAATPNGDFWVVGQAGSALYVRGDLMVQVSTGTSAVLNAVWVAAENDVWIAGDGGLLLRGNVEIGFKPVFTATEANLRAVWGTSRGELFLAGELPSSSVGVLLRRE